MSFERQNGRRRHSFLGHLRIQVQPPKDELICRSSSKEPSGDANEVADDTCWAVLVLGPSEIHTQSHVVRLGAVSSSLDMDIETPDAQGCIKPPACTTSRLDQTVSNPVTMAQLSENSSGFLTRLWVQQRPVDFFSRHDSPLNQFQFSRIMVRSLFTSLVHSRDPPPSKWS